MLVFGLVLLYCADMVMVSGKRIAKDIQNKLREEMATLENVPRAAFIAVAPTPVTKRYLSYKQAAAGAVGIVTEVIELPLTDDTTVVIAAIDQALKESDGIVVQLPLPDHIDTKQVLSAIPPSHDVDALRPDAIISGRFRSPVAQAVAIILERHDVAIAGRSAVVVGNGRLVGKPVAAFLEQAGAQVQVVTEHTADSTDRYREADIIVLGAGVPGLLQPEMIKSGVVIIDAATSEQSGRLTGDANPACAEQASVFTPVPGGVGPITIAALLKNVYQASVSAFASRAD